MILSLPGLAALAALLFTWQQVGQASRELRLSEQGQITNRFNAAIGNLGSDSEDVRLGGLYSLERIMHDSARDHSTVVSVVSAYLRRHGAVTTGASPAQKPIPVDIDAAIGVLVRRPFGHDKGLVIDLSRVDLRGWTPPRTDTHEFVRLDGAILTGSDLSGVDLIGAQLRGALLSAAKLRKTDLAGAGLRDATLDEADLREATLVEADLRGVGLGGANLRDAYLSDANMRNSFVCSTTCPDLTATDLTGANMTGSSLTGADLTKATICSTVTWFTFDPEAPAASHPTKGADERDCATLRDTDLSGARLARMDLAGADLTGAILTGADLTKANLSRANLTKANLTGAKLSGVRLTGATLTGARGLPAALR
jgi:uncharacterized protein YjbI with pentapeptide repeats